MAAILLCKNQGKPIVKAAVLFGMIGILLRKSRIGQPGKLV